MSKFFLNILFPVACLFLLSACNEIIEPDLSKKTVNLISPPDNYQTASVTNNFDWNVVEGATQYRLQIAQPSFFGIQQMIADTLLEDNSFLFTLAPGTYQWRVMPLNESSEGNYTTRTITINASADLSVQTLVLVSPAANYITNQASVYFKWDTLYNADDYRLQVINSSSVTAVDVILTSDSAWYSFTEGQYTWQVRGQNASSNTQYSMRSFTIDFTPPPVSVSLMPAIDSIFTPDTLLWSRNSSAIIDSIFIYPDSLISTPVFRGSVSATYYIFSGIVYQDYFWRLKSGDAAGNWSGYSPLQKLWIKP